MLKGFEWRTAEDAGDQKLLSNVRQHGWHIVAVFDDGNAEEVRPDFAFSVGLYLNHQHPEIVVMGLPQAKAGRIINAVGAYVRSGKQIKPDVRYSEFAEGRDVIFRSVRDENYGEYLGSGLWFYRSLLPEFFPALQLVWPDMAGKFPWEDGFDRGFSRLQHDLWEVQARAPEEEP
jgi:hypothetical protein